METVEAAAVKDVSRWALAVDCLRYYPRHHRWAALCRDLWDVLVRGEKGESCELCGRRYVWWSASDYLYQAVVGSDGGLYCPACFDRMAERHGLVLRWSPITREQYIAETYGRPR